MVRKLICSLFMMTVAVGFVCAEEFNATITAVDATKGTVTYQKYLKTKKGEEKKKDGDAVTVSAKGATIAKGKYSKEDKKWEAGDKIEGGLGNEMFAKIGEKGIGARFTVEDKKASQILIVGGGKKKKKAAE